ncbi:MAG: GSCFA domain-containing protein, partial [Cyclobacteriaceae bacterium]|nr:GSCFA domain-containing protein [Cyclobacteriaceae bacterium]
LRDYRFYKEDMIHPNNVAIEYIWNHFSSTFFNSKTSGINLEWEKIKKALEHRPFNEKSTSYFQFLNHIQKKIEDLESAIPLKAEKEEVLNRLKHFENEK